MPNSRFSPSLIHVYAPFLPLIHGLCAFSRPLLIPVSTAPFLPASQFTVCTSRFTRPREEGLRKLRRRFGSFFGILFRAFRMNFHIDRESLNGGSQMGA